MQKIRVFADTYEADVVVINHYLLFADLVLKEEGFGELLPGADAFILDEAHQLPEVAGHFFGFSLSSRQFTSFRALRGGRRTAGKPSGVSLAGPGQPASA